MFSTSFPGFPRINYYVTTHDAYTSKYNVCVDDIHVYVDSKGVNRAGPNAGRAGLGPNFFNRAGLAWPGQARFGPGRTTS